MTVTLDPWARPVWILKFNNFDPPANFLGSPQNFKTNFWYSFSGPITRKCLDHAPPPWVTTLGLWPPKFNGGRLPQILDQISKITPISNLLSYCIKVAYRSSDLEDSAAKEKNKKKEKRKNFCWKIAHLRLHYVGWRYNEHCLEFTGKFRQLTSLRHEERSSSVVEPPVLISQSVFVQMRSVISV